MKGLGKPVHTWGLGNRFCCVVGALLLPTFDCFFPLEYGHSWDHSFMEERDKKVPGMTPKPLGLIHPRPVDVFQLKSRALSGQAMLWQAPDSKSEDITTARCFTRLSRPRQARSSAGPFAKFRFPFGKPIAEAQGCSGGSPRCT